MINSCRSFFTLIVLLFKVYEFERRVLALCLLLLYQHMDIIMVLSRLFLPVWGHGRLGRWMELRCLFHSKLMFSSISQCCILKEIIEFSVYSLPDEKWGQLCYRPELCWSFSESASLHHSSTSWDFRNYLCLTDQKQGVVRLILCSMPLWLRRRLTVLRYPRLELWSFCFWYWRSWIRIRHPGWASAGYWTVFKPFSWACSFFQHWSLQSWWIWRACCNLTFWFVCDTNYKQGENGLCWISKDLERREISMKWWYFNG